MLKMQVIGNLGKDAIVNTVNGKTVINFSVCHTEKFTSNGEQKEKSVWVDAAYWTDKTAVAPYLVKGCKVYVEGNPEVRTFDKSDGTQGHSLSLRVREVFLLGGNKPNNTATTGNTAAPQENTEPIEDLPF